MAQSVPLTPQSAAKGSLELEIELEREIGKTSSGLLIELTRLLLIRQLTQPAGGRQGSVGSQICHKLHTFVMQGSVCSHLRHKVPHISGRRMLASGTGQCLLSTLCIPPRPPNNQLLFQGLLRRSQSGVQPLAPGIPSPAMQPAPPFVTPANQAVRPDNFQQQQAPAAAEAEAQPKPQLLGQQWQQLLYGPTPVGPQHLTIGQLDFDFLQLVTASAPIMAESELQRQANHIVDVAVYGRQADLDLWLRQLVMASQQ